MEDLTNWPDVFFESLRAFGATFMGAIPGIIGAIVVLLLGWLFARLVSGGITRLLKVARFDTLAEKVKADQFLKRANITIAPSKLIGRFVYWILILLVVITASDTLGWHAVSEEVSNLLGYLPKLMIAIVFFIVGTYIATFVRDFIQSATHSLGISSGKIIGAFVFYLLLIIITLTALEQAGMDTTIITSNLLLIMGAILAAAAISYGFASREILSNLLAGFFNRRTFVVGMTIEVNGVKGQIIQVSNISATIKNEQNEKVVIPAHELLTNKVKIIES